MVEKDATYIKWKQTNSMLYKRTTLFIFLLSTKNIVFLPFFIILLFRKCLLNFLLKRSSFPASIIAYNINNEVIIMKICVRPGILAPVHQKLLIEDFPTIDFVDKLEDDAEVLISFPNIIRKETLDSLPNLKWIQLFSAGFDQGDLPYLKSRSITLTNARGIYSIPIAEDVVARLLAINRQLPQYIQDQEQKKWNRELNGYELYGSTIGFLGAGSIAVETAKRLVGFNVRLLAYREHQGKVEPFDEIFTGEKGLYDLIRQSDYIISVLPSNQETIHLLDQKRLRLMKKDAVLINVGRGDLINEQELVEILRSGHLRGVSLDVYEVEPLPKDSPLYQLPNVLLTPHHAGASTHTSERLYQLIKKNIRHFLTGGELDNIVRL
jgi:phosphoglycerate dehydrogenase-like enzyme